MGRFSGHFLTVAYILCGFGPSLIGIREVAGIAVSAIDLPLILLRPVDRPDLTQYEKKALGTLTKPFPSVPADEEAGDGEEGGMDVVAFFVTDAEPAEFVQRTEDPFYDAPMNAQPTAMLCVSLGDQRSNAALAQRHTDFLVGVVGTICQDVCVGLRPVV